MEGRKDAPKTSQSLMHNDWHLTRNLRETELGKYSKNNKLLYVQNSTAVNKTLVKYSTLLKKNVGLKV